MCGLSRIVVEVTDFLLKNEAETTALIDRAARNAMKACSHAAARGFLEATSAEDDPRQGRRVAAGFFHADPLTQMGVPHIESRHIGHGLYHQQAWIHMLLAEEDGEEK